ncbi:MAG: hypothetical protein VB074_14735 [Proteiniphilum sp.]|uniref:hypothetical protein n=1 Tax=Proteiniphilum sp. TaxID=1926877 RepID=UPI002B202B1B|nr:hypothetical protein [Proteiniphilum sp.]MEA5129433.1 hypothetical protein [Proteiniphilum sp.]
MRYSKLLLTALLLMNFIISSNIEAKEIKLKTNTTELAFNEKGYYLSIHVEGVQILQEGSYPLITVATEGKLIEPVGMEVEGEELKVKMEDGGVVRLKYDESPISITFEVADIPGKYDVLLYGPVILNINEVVGDVIGVAQGKGVAFGIQALNIKTNAGIPQEYFAQVSSKYGYEGREAVLSVRTTPVNQLAASDIGNGAVLQFSCCRRDKLAYRDVMNLEGSMVIPLKDDDAFIKGSKIAFFGSRADDALASIGAIEKEHGLPHPLFDGEWGKISRAAMKSYMISDFNEENFDMALEKAKIADFKYVYHSGPFLDWGHFNWDPKFVSGGDEGVKKMVEKAKSQGIKMGVHTLSNFITTNDPYVTPIPSKNLLKQGVLELASDIDNIQTEITIKKTGLFALPMTLNAMQIKDELITYGTIEEKEDLMVLQNCTRGAFNTNAASHSKSDKLYKLWDYPYKTLFPDVELQDKMVDRLVELFNNTGLEQISFDGLEGCMYTGYDEYAMARFVSRFYEGLNHNVLNDGSNLNHYMWHIHTRMNWGEPWGEAMRTGQVDNRIKNQDYFRRNLFPRMLGWFLIRLADRNFDATTMEDLEWALSESAGFDAGYAMTINMRTIRGHGQIDRLLAAIKNWDGLRESQSFTTEQMERLKDPETEWHLEKVDHNNFILYPLHISKSYRCSLGEMQPGQPGGADWSWESPFDGQFAIRLKVEGDGSVRNPSFTTPKGIIKFPCEIESGQYLLYELDGKAIITDKNYNTITEVIPQGSAALMQGVSSVSFSCEKGGEDDDPDVVVRFITRGEGEKIVKRSY